MILAEIVYDYVCSLNVLKYLEIDEFFGFKFVPFSRVQMM